MKILGKEIKLKTPFVEFVETTYKNMAGKKSSWCWVQRPNARKAVVIAAVTESPIYSDGLNPQIEDYERKLVVIKEYRVPIEGYEVGFPAGLIDEGETPEDAVRRELTEETGLKVEKILHISPAVLSSAGLTDEAVHMAYVVVSGEPNKDKLEESEDIDTFLLDKDEVAALMVYGDEPIGKSAYCVMRNFAKFGEI